LKKFHTRKGGFTLIELMIVVAIIGILAAIAIPNFLRFQLKAKSSEGKTNLAAIRTAETSYFSEFGAYVSANASPAAWGGATKVGFTNSDGWSEKPAMVIQRVAPLISAPITRVRTQSISDPRNPTTASRRIQTGLRSETANMPSTA